MGSTNTRFQVLAVSGPILVRSFNKEQVLELLMEHRMPCGSWECRDYHGTSILRWIVCLLGSFFKWISFVSGNVNFSVSAETLQTSELCGTEVATVPEIGRKDTVVKLLLIEVSKPVLFDSHDESRKW